MRFDTLPPEFNGLQGKVNYIQRVNSSEYASSCPQCGGAPHKGGDLPDRFRMWTNANGKNKIMGWCRKCSYTWFPTHDTPLSKEDFEIWRKRQIEIEERKKQEAEQALKLLKSQKLWEQYHLELNNWAYEVLESWGISKVGARFWKIGLIKDYTVFPDEYHSPAISIPSWGFDWEVRNIKVRVLNPRTGKDRYRSLYKMGTDFPFVARPDLKTDTCLVVEGEKKAMVSAAQLPQFQVVGMPTVTPSPKALSELDSFKRIYLCLDPDSKKVQNGISPLRRMIDILGKERVKVVNLPDKVDDMVVKYGLNLEDAIRYAK